MKIWVWPYGLDGDVLEVEADLAPRYRLRSVPMAYRLPGSPHWLYAYDGQWTVTRAAAVAKLETVRNQTVDRMRGQIARLRARTF